MITKALVLSMYESSLLTHAGIPVTTGWQAIADSYPEPEVASLFAELSSDFLARTPSLTPFEKNQALKDDSAVACNFAELAANTTSYEQPWADMAVAYVLKKKLATSAPTEADVRLGSYLLSYGNVIPEMPLDAELERWSDSEIWKLEKDPNNVTFPEDWWSSFTIDQADIQFPRTIVPILKSAFEAGALDSMIPDTASRWTRFAAIANQVFA